MAGAGKVMYVISGIKNIKLTSLFKLIPVLTVVMEVLLFYPWLVWFGRITHWTELAPHMNLVSYIILALYAEIVSRYSVKKNWSVKRVRFLVLPSAVLLWLVLFRWSLGGGYPLWDAGWFGYLNANIFQAGVALLSGPFFIWRGIAISRQSNMSEDLYRKFIIGLVFIVILLIVWGFSGLQSSGIWSTVGTYGFSYFAVGLLILAIANLENLSHTLSRHQEAASAFRRRWSSMLLVLIVAILGLAVAGASIFSTNLAGMIVHAFSVFGDWLLLAFAYIIYPFGFVAEFLWFVFEWIVSLITHGKTPQPVKIQMPDFSKYKQNQQPTGTHLSPVLLMSLKWTLLAVVIGLAIFFIGRYLMRYWQSKMEEDVDEENESLWSWVNFRADLRNFFQWLFSWLYRKKTLVEEAGTEQITDDIGSGPDRELSVREIYRSLLRQGWLIHLPRDTSETPYEYSGKLKNRRENIAEELDTITDSYVAERYGNAETNPEKVSLLNQLWRMLRSKMEIGKS